MEYEKIGQSFKSGLSLCMKKLKKLSIQFTGKKAYIMLGSVITILLVTAGLFFSQSVYEVKIDGQSVGFVKDKETASTIISNVVEREKDRYNSELEFHQDVVYEKTKAGQSSITSEDVLEKNIASKLDLKTKASVIYIDGNGTFALKDAADAQYILEKIKSSYIESVEDSVVEDAAFVESVEIKEELVGPESVKGSEEVYELIIKGKDELKTHKVEKGESLWSIARQNNLDVDSLIKANPELNIERLQIGQEINLNLQNPYITLETREKLTYKEEVPYDTKTEYSSTTYKDQTSVKVKGTAGVKEITAEVIKRNGVEVSRTVLEEKTTKQPVNRIVVQGTKARPSTSVAGAYGILSRGTLTSKFGSRWGTQHKGIDIAAPKGSPIYAWNSGKVTFSGVYGGYGNLVMIDHENGYVTYYGHNSQNLVKAGQRVTKGQKIALVGSTGDSTGNHVHFEVRKMVFR